MPISDKYAMLNSQGSDLPVRFQRATVEAALAAQAFLTQEREELAAKFRPAATAPTRDSGYDWTVAMARAVEDCDVSRIGGPAQHYGMR